jgi:hypothetical protein
MFMLLLIFEIVCGVFEWKQISTGFFIVCLYYVLTLEIQLSRGQGYDPF